MLFRVRGAAAPPRRVVESRRVKTTTGHRARLGDVLDLLEQLEPDHVGQLEIEDHAVEVAFARAASSARRRCRPHDARILVRRAAPRCAQALAPRRPRRRAALAPAAARTLRSDRTPRRATSRRRRLRRGRRTRRARARAARVLSTGEDLHRDVARHRIVLELIEQRQPSMSGRNMSSEIAVGRYFRASASASAPRGATTHLEARVARQVEQDLARSRIVLDDQHHAVARLRCRPGRRGIALDRARAPPAGCRQRPRAALGSLRAALDAGAPSRRRRSTRQVQGERAARARPLSSVISPPSRCASSRLIASPSPVPPYLRLVPASACWNASKMMLLLVLRDADAGVADRERDDRRRAAQHRVSGVQPPLGDADAQRRRRRAR